ncbi:MAG TPA: hypothetical protein VFI99_03760 [Nocardioides sp.]|nr:hypothetical protein [Nocardioides sp.]
MQPQAERDQKTLIISTALLLFVLAVVAGGAILWAANTLLGVSDEVVNGLIVAAMCLSGVLSLWYVVRAPRN